MQTASLLRACIDLVHACREYKFAESCFALSCLLLDETVDSKRNSESIRRISESLGAGDAGMVDSS